VSEVSLAEMSDIKQPHALRVIWNKLLPKPKDKKAPQECLPLFICDSKKRKQPGSPCLEK
jgi:hypothetical protein